MLVTTIALLAATAVLPRAAAFEPFTVEHFNGIHQPKGSNTSVNFLLSNADPAISILNVNCFGFDDHDTFREFTPYGIHAKCDDHRARFGFRGKPNGEFTLDVLFNAHGQVFQGKQHTFPSHDVNPIKPGSNEIIIGAPAVFHMNTSAV